jgi:uncharacterized coiled-coil protein SlyX
MIEESKVSAYPDGAGVPTIEERVAFLEGQVSEQSHALLEVRDSVRHLEQRMEARFDSFEQRIDARLAGVDRRIDGLEDKVSRQFVWTVGVQVTTFVAIVAALLSRG